MATGKDKFELVIEVNSAQGNAAIKGVNKSLSDLERGAINSSRRSSVEVDKLNGAFGRFGKTVQDFARNPLQATQNGLSGLLTKLGPVAVGVGAIGVAAGIAGAAILRTADAAAAAAVEIDNLSKTTGMSVEQVQELQRLGEETGVTDLARSMEKLNYELGRDEGGDFTESIIRMNIAIKNGAGSLYYLEEMRKKFAEIEDPIERSEAAAAALGRRLLHELGPFVLDASKSITGSMDEIRRSGAVMSEAQIAHLKDVDDALDRNGRRWVALKNTIWDWAGSAVLAVEKVIQAIENPRTPGQWKAKFYRDQLNAENGLVDGWTGSVGMSGGWSGSVGDMGATSNSTNELERRQKAIAAADAIASGTKRELVGLTIQLKELEKQYSDERIKEKGQKFDYERLAILSQRIAKTKELIALENTKQREAERLRDEQARMAEKWESDKASREERQQKESERIALEGMQRAEAQFNERAESANRFYKYVADKMAANKAAVESLIAENEAALISQLRREGDIQGATNIELAQLDRRKADYEGNAKAIEQIEERKKLVIIDANREIADNARSEFERSAQSIEGFFNRVFMNARSLSDMWRQLWGQLANYAVQQMARMVAASVGGYRQAAAPAGGGMAAMIPTMMGGGGTSSAGGYGGVGTPPFVGGGSGGGMGSIFSGGFSGMGTNFANFAMSPAGALAGVGIFAAGAKRGGALGLGMSVGGGFLAGAGIGSMIAGPFGAGIGAAIGLGVGLTTGIIGLFRKSPEEKLKEKIRSAYGVTIRDKGVLQQILSIAQGFGGNLDMTIRNREVVELISLYAQTTNQAMRGAPKQMTSATLIQSGGSLSMAASYTNGSLSMGNLPGAGIDNVRATGASGGTVINISIPGAKDFFEKETTSVIARNGRVVSTANAKAAASNYGRREMTALQLKPGLVTS